MEKKIRKAVENALTFQGSTLVLDVRATDLSMREVRLTAVGDIDLADRITDAVVNALAPRQAWSVTEETEAADLAATVDEVDKLQEYPYSSTNGMDVADFLGHLGGILAAHYYLWAAFTLNPTWKAARRDKELVWVCEAVAQILIKMRVPGVKWLDLL